jgi:hypothetical protein
VAITAAPAPYVKIHSYSDAPNTVVPPPDFGESNTSAEGGYDYYWLSDEMKRAAVIDRTVNVSYYVFYDAATSGNELGRVRCDRVLQWSDQVPLLLGS